MKAFGFDDTDIQRGEMKAALVDAADVEYPEQCAHSLDWEYMSTRFADAKAELVRRMQDDCADSEVIAQVKRLKASYIPVEG